MLVIEKYGKFNCVDCDSCGGAGPGLIDSSGAGRGEAHGREQETRRFLKRKQQTAPQHKLNMTRPSPPTMPACWTGPKF